MGPKMRKGLLEIFENFLKKVVYMYDFLRLFCRFFKKIDKKVDFFRLFLQ